MNETVTCEGEVRVPLPLEETIDLFTPEGERRWVPGWDPSYPAGEPSRAPGSVFVTRAGGRTTTWVVVDSGTHAMRYARVTPGVQAGTISVHCRPHGAGTSVTVRYELTALDDTAVAELDGFARGYDEYMTEWERLIGAVLAADV